MKKKKPNEFVDVAKTMSRLAKKIEPLLAGHQVEVQTSTLAFVLTKVLIKHRFTDGRTKGRIHGSIAAGLAIAVRRAFDALSDTDFITP